GVGRVEVQHYELAGAHATHLGVTQVAQRVLDRAPLRIQHARLETHQHPQLQDTPLPCAAKVRAKIASTFRSWRSRSKHSTSSSGSRILPSSGSRASRSYRWSPSSQALSACFCTSR